MSRNRRRALVRTASLLAAASLLTACSTDDGRRAELLWGQQDQEGVVSWSFACPTTDAERSYSVGVNGSESDREAALTTAVERGRQLILDVERGGGAVCAPGEVFVSVNQEMAWVEGFFDPDVSDPELRERVEAAIAEQRTAGQPARDQPPAPPVLSVTMPGSVDEQWDRVASWIGEKLPAVPIVGADAEAIAQAEAATGIEWPAELKAFFRSVNGFPRDTWFPILPMHGLFDLDRMLEDRQMMIDAWGGLDDAGIGEAVVGAQAGEPAWTFLPEFIPIAGLDSYYLFVDTRPGELYGCVTEFADEEADYTGPRWLSISAMLTDLADSLENGTTFGGWLRPVLVDGVLDWQ